MRWCSCCGTQARQPRWSYTSRASSGRIQMLVSLDKLALTCAPRNLGFQPASHNHAQSRRRHVGKGIWRTFLAMFAARHERGNACQMCVQLSPNSPDRDNTIVTRAERSLIKIRQVTQQFRCCKPCILAPPQQSYRRFDP